MDIALVQPIPAWAKWLAQEPTGKWWVYSERPHLVPNGFAPSNGKFSHVWQSDPAGWQHSLISLN